ncbi:uncharacterized protein BHQ10_008197 [Talaromyces amestolkiae]|uniref:Glycoside hydrolase family 5 C-terminal domain-containing protein n=1 Tax=Talaromyces amestolkiae TaxID=1196081 RepID=A0A364L8P5_TALAM|nr:uncharacterized protein BHQ10_008197 [Talaromyces amestolkiae]RAO72185.1 hypothetical protein BHQ10_008197 [Talaromyces amestolkiae]
MAPLRLHIEGHKFRDPYHREITLRGINVAGDAKYPKNPDTPSHVAEGFLDGDNVSFVGRPFSLEEAPLHFGRLRKWGYNTIRYIFTWEAIEHSGPGKYDDEWVAYTIEVLRIAKQYNFYVFMDPHQDVWSRFSGGSGAPLWTLYAAGFNPESFNKTQAALVHNTWPNPSEFPKMIWSRDFAPKAIIDGRNIQDYLQEHYIAACRYLALKIHDAGDLEDEVVIGWESLNEPNRGLVGYQDINVVPPEQQLQLGTSPTAFQAILNGSGRACEMSTWAFGSFGPYETGKELVDPEGESAWLPADYDDTKYGWKRDPNWRLGICIWAQHGVWDPSTDELLQGNYFSKVPKTGEPLNYDVFTNTYFMDHYRAFRDAIRSVHSNCILLNQPPVMEVPPKLKGTEDDDPNMVHAAHYYDGLTLLTKHWNRMYNVDVIGVLRGKYWTPAFAVKVGETAIRNCLRNQLKFLRDESFERMGDHPMIFSEIGIPYDMDDKSAYKTGDYSSQISAMDANHFALEGSGSNGFTLWVYATQNDHEWGDQWNGEDLSIYSRDDLELPSSLSDSTLTLDRNSPSFSQSSSSIDNGKITHHNIKNVIETPSFSRQASKASSEPEGKPGFRAAEAYIRPSAVYTNGDLLAQGFDLKSCKFTLSLYADKPTTQEAPTEIYLPEFHFPAAEIGVTVSGGKWTTENREESSYSFQVLKWWHGEGDQYITIQGIKRRASGLIISPEDESYLDQCQKNCSVM